MLSSSYLCDISGCRLCQEAEKYDADKIITFQTNERVLNVGHGLKVWCQSMKSKSPSGIFACNSNLHILIRPDQDYFDLKMLLTNNLFPIGISEQHHDPTS